MALRLIFALLVVSWIAEWTALICLADSTSWKVVLLEVLTTGLLGLAVIRHVSMHFRRETQGRRCVPAHLSAT